MDSVDLMDPRRESTDPNPGSFLRSLGRILVYVTFTLAIIPIQYIAIRMGSTLRRGLPRWYHRQCCKILGFRVERRGRQSRVHPTLYVSNHSSYIDIMVLGSLLPASFIAKSEVASWPFFGWLAKLQRSVFVERRRHKSGEGRDEMTTRLQAGDDLVLFPEGTSNDGNWVLPFKSALFAAANTEFDGQPITVQPVSLAYTRLDGVPMGRYLRPFFAWYGDMELASHIWRAVGLGWVTVVVDFHPPVTLAEFSSRKAMSDHCHRQVAIGVAAALSGRPRRRIEQLSAARELARLVDGRSKEEREAAEQQSAAAELPEPDSSGNPAKE
ncbi:1-acyl-sn-glycerol-3-phosphate acyltransferase [Pelagibius sp. Alg239-R121]|uniref:lysophospholipid acyltransferase family protein n=1 Tax=Pelagibius sp. Alg239-R121 TaxID=2993448 RepID=UPI0024A73606|nr:lysophospholipid acyltransferase family protein [Pelagibius sp. Alg239-R121]